VRAVALHLGACALAALAPFIPRPGSAPAAEGPFAWPSHFEGRPLTERPLSERERRFAQDFPGRIGLFSDGERQLVLRFTTRATRRMHPSSDCLRAAGYAILPRPSRRAADGTGWGCFAARRADEELLVCEQIRDQRGATWPDPSSWYWPALTGSSRGPWWSASVFERVR